MNASLHAVRVNSSITMSSAVQGKSQQSPSATAPQEFSDALLSASEATLREGRPSFASKRRDDPTGLRDSVSGLKDKPVTFNNEQSRSLQKQQIGAGASPAQKVQQDVSTDLPARVSKSWQGEQRRGQNDAKDHRARKLSDGILEDTTSRVFSTPNLSHNPHPVLVASVADLNTSVEPGVRGDGASVVAPATSETSIAPSNAGSTTSFLTKAAPFMTSDLMSVPMPTAGLVDGPTRPQGQALALISSDEESQTAVPAGSASTSGAASPQPSIPSANDDARPVQAVLASASTGDAGGLIAAIMPPAPGTGPADSAAPVVSDKWPKSDLEGATQTRPEQKRVADAHGPPASGQVEPASVNNAEDATPLSVVPSLVNPYGTSSASAVAGQAQANRQIHGISKDHGAKADGQGRQDAGDSRETSGGPACGSSQPGVVSSTGRDGEATVGGAADAAAQAAPQSSEQAALQQALHPTPLIGLVANGSASSASVVSGQGVLAGNNLSAATASSVCAPTVTTAQIGASVATAVPSLSGAQLVQTMHGSEMKVGLNSAEFGKISIQTAVTHQTLSAQISTEHIELSRALAVHLPAMEQRLGNAYGLHTRVEIRDSNTSAHGGSSTQEREQGRREARGSSAVPSVPQGSVAFVQVPARPSGSEMGRLDIRV